MLGSESDLTDAERHFLQDLLSMWEDGYEEATSDVIADRSIGDVEQLLSTVDSMHKDHAMVVSILGKLRGEALQEQTTS